MKRMLKVPEDAFKKTEMPKSRKIFFDKSFTLSYKSSVLLQTNGQISRKILCIEDLFFKKNFKESLKTLKNTKIKN